MLLMLSLFDCLGLERAAGFWENSLHELRRLQEKVRCGWLHFVCKEGSRRMQEEESRSLAQQQSKANPYLSNDA